MVNVSRSGGGSYRAAARLGALALAALLIALACGSTSPSGSGTTTPSPSASPSASPTGTACSTPFVTSAASEPQLVRAAIAYDKASRQLILFGDPGGGAVTQTWAWTSQAGWKQLSPAHSPPGRTWGNMAYDEATGVIILFGGQSATPVNGGLNPLNDTWTWDGADWTQQSPAASPPATVNMALDYEPARHIVLGVRDNDASADTETWQWDGSSWSQLRPIQAPQYAKQGAGLAYAPAVSASVLFGTVFGIGVPAPDGTTWTYSANTWTGYPPGAGDPQPRSFPGMSTDQQGGVLLFGGAGSGSTVFNDTWAWAGAWAKRSVAVAPAARAMPLMAFDSTCRLDVLYGGELQTGSNRTDFYDTWVWDGQAWVKVG
jgi:hypothetical protein